MDAVRTPRAFQVREGRVHTGLGAEGCSQAACHKARQPGNSGLGEAALADKACPGRAAACSRGGRRGWSRT